MTDQFGPSIGIGDVRNAIFQTLQSPPEGHTQPLIVYYLADRERKAGLAARSIDPPATYRGGIDFEPFQDDSPPTIIAVITPDGHPERFGEDGTYAQAFTVQLGAIVTADQETDAQVLAENYGIAIASLITKNRGLNPGGAPFATSTVLDEYPTVEFAFDATTNRNILRATVTFQTLVAPVVVETRPFEYPDDPYAAPGEFPQVGSTNVELIVQPIGS